MTTEPDVVGPVPQRIEVGAAQVRRLIATQFPQWSQLPVRPVPAAGWDNRTFRLGESMLVRLPSAAEYAHAVAKEQRWLPALAPHLPLPVPVPLGLGAPGDDYPWQWSVYRWIEGEPATLAPIADLDAFAATLAGFLLALQQVDPAGGPEPGLHNWFRGGPLRNYDPLMTRALATLDDTSLRDDITRVWQAALATGWSGRPVWFHGDIAPGNLLTTGGELSAVIDFGTCGVGDPSCDLAIAWTLLTGPSRAVLRERLAADPAMWLRGAGWALWKAVVLHTGGEPDAKHVIDQIIAEFAHDRLR
ncbi:aminoglycoside phosphotransferase family protein [Winogradskya consettensis]|uniref:Aminoglycoside phosphotransferase n=1 Tax=Winogradskya consettensis TaxID=113560 RepID=A0A919VR34_9ACTN|nr:aminoglycoside phosphotransferase family protein [Actinoplanes consettensis]GIM73286.1 aminoglycoside phosphotransferase [Actinoplanes consettensis]